MLQHKTLMNDFHCG